VYKPPTIHTARIAVGFGSDDGEAEADAEDADETAGGGWRGGLIQHRVCRLKATAA
jgi:hypothetical protein